MLIALDFDGTLVDSYKVIPHIYEDIKKEYGFDEGFVNAMLITEELGDYFGIFDREFWFRVLFKENYYDVVEFYWEKRTEGQILFEDVLDFLKKDYDFYLVTAKDDNKEIKYNRIKRVGIEKYFRDIIIYGEEVRNIEEALIYLKDIDKEVIYIDDKNSNLSKLLNLGIKLFKRRFEPPFPLKLAWKYPKVNIIEINKLHDIFSYI